MRSDLDQGVDARLSHRADRRLEEDRLAQVAEPVLGVHLGGVGGLAGDGRVRGISLGRGWIPASAATSSSRTASTWGE